MMPHVQPLAISGSQLDGHGKAGSKCGLRGRGPPPVRIVSIVNERPTDPHHHWPEYFRAGDGVRLDDGRPAVVLTVQDYAPHPPARWELIVFTLDHHGNADTFIIEPWNCRPDPAAAQELPGPGLP